MRYPNLVTLFSSPRASTLLLTAALSSCTGCSSSEDHGSSSGGASNSGGTSVGSGGHTSGGSPGTGGSLPSSSGGSFSVGMGGAGGAAAGGSGGSNRGGVGGTGDAGGALSGSGGSVASGGKGSGGSAQLGGAAGSGGASSGGALAGSGGKAGGAGGSSGGATTGGSGQSGGSAAGGVAGSTGTGTCTASKAVSTGTGSGSHKVTIETNAGSGISQGTIYRPTDLGGTEKYPILVWGNGACSQDGFSNKEAMSEIASHGYFVIADGTPNGSGSRNQTSNWPQMAKPLLDYITWAVAENAKSCSAYYGSLDTTKIASNGFSCGGLMSEGTAGDSRMTTVGVTSSGLTSSDSAFYKTVHTPVLIILGGSSDIAYDNGERDYSSLSALGIPIMLFSKNIGHGGDLGSTHGGDFTKIHLGWLNWRLKGDESASGKGVLIGSSCTYCTNSQWEVKSKNLP